MIKLNIASATLNHTVFPGYMTFPSTSAEVTLLRVAEVNEALTPEERAQLEGFLTLPIHGLSKDKFLMSKPDPDAPVDSEEPTPEIRHDGTIQEFADLIQGGLIGPFRYTQAFKDTDAALPEEDRLITNPDEIFYAVSFPPLEHVNGETDTVKLFGRGKAKPYFTLWGWIQSVEFKSVLEPVPTNVN